MTMTGVKISRATPKDAVDIMGLIRELADFEKMPEGVKIDETRLASDLENGAVHGLLLKEGDKTVAMVLYYYAYSTWEGQYIHMEDLYVQPESRRKGYGQRLWSELAKIAKEKDCKRMQWNCLNWNKNAIALYTSMPSVNLTEAEGWIMFRLDPEGIATTAAAVDSQ